MKSVGNASRDHPVKDRIHDCALKLFATKGYSTTSVREIVEAAGITKPTLYYYFGNKDGLYRSLFLGYLEVFFADFERVCVAPGSLRARLQAVAELHFKWLNEKPLLPSFFYRAIFGILPQKPALAADLLRFRGRDTDLLIRVLSEGADAGAIPREAVSEFTVIRFLGHLQAYIVRRALALEDALTPELAKKMVAAFLNGVGGPRTGADAETETSEV